ncbi:MAG: hypothetical protein CSA74_03615 [Rhodobacterales bacterium]|nr:MAG: hypothetical protein CSA74_03615 [Rhodobacterales bacterium]
MVACKRDRLIILVVALVLSLNYLVHVFGFAPVPEEISQLILPKSIQIDAERMRATDYYRPFADAYPSFMTLIVVLAFPTGALILLLLARRLLVWLKLLHDRELEHAGFFFLLIFAFALAVNRWLPESSSIIFHENKRLGGLPFGLQALYITFPTLLTLEGFLGMFLFPEAMNYHIRHRYDPINAGEKRERNDTDD